MCESQDQHIAKAIPASFQCQFLACHPYIALHFYCLCFFSSSIVVAKIYSWTDIF